MMHEHPEVIYQKHTVLSAIAIGLSALVIAFIVSCTVVIIYGMHLVSQKTDRFISAAEGAVRRLPDLRKSLPPILIDNLDDHRRPDYCKQIETYTETKPLEGHEGMLQTTVKVINSGRETVSLLSLRVVILDSRGQILAESNEWAATPVTAEPEWRGPLQPRYMRYVGFTHRQNLPASLVKSLRAEVEITDLRICPEQNETQPADSRTSMITQ